MTRREFLWLCGASGAAITLARPATAAPGESPLRFVPLRTGTCSFCGKSRRELGGLVGIPGRRDKICDECTPCFLHVIAASREDRHHPRVHDVHCCFCDRHRRDVRLMLSGPRVFVCDRCTHAAADMLEANGAALHDQRMTKKRSPAHAIMAMGLAEQTRQVLARMTPEEEKEMRRRFGIDELSMLETLGRDFPVTRERIHKIEARKAQGRWNS